MTHHPDPAATPYPHLLEPITLGGGGGDGTGGLTLRNRVVMGSMHTGLEDTVRDLPRLAAYVAERARGGVGLIVTGGYAPDKRGWLKPLASEMTTRLQAIRHQEVTGAVHDEGGAIALQVLHAGRYGYHPFSVSASRRKSPITPFRPSALSSRGVDRTATHFARTAALAVKARYDAVEVMGSEGYLINQFLAPRTNDRTDAWGGSAEKRMRFPLEVVRRTRELVGGDLPIVYRISLLDLVEGGQRWDEVVELAQRLVGAGVTVLNTGIGWHEARVPTIITQVPPGAWRDATARLRADLHASGQVVPVCASNRINTPEMAEEVLATGQADLVSMARPLLADPAFVAKAAAGRADEINTCIACNQACLDHAFANRTASCLVNPRACRETTLVLAPTRSRARVAVVGAGPAGLATAVSAAERGLAVTLFEQRDEVGGQFRYAMAVPGKEDFAHTLRHYTRRLEVLGVDVRLATTASVEDLRGFDEVVVATGVEPRVPDLEGVDHPSVVTYAQVLSGEVVPGARVAVVGAGGIGVDTSHFLAHDPSETLQDWKDHWGVGDPAEHPGGLTGRTPRTPARQVTLLQRKTSTIGRDLGKTSGWAHRAVLKQSGVEQLRGVTYSHVDDAGLHVVVDGAERVLAVDHVVLCAGQESVRSLYDALAALPETDRPRLHLVGGADLAAELDAKRAIEQGTRVAAGLGDHLPDRAATTDPVGAPA